MLAESVHPSLMHNAKKVEKDHLNLIIIHFKNAHQRLRDTVYMQFGIGYQKSPKFNEQTTILLSSVCQRAISGVEG